MNFSFRIFELTGASDSDVHQIEAFGIIDERQPESSQIDFHITRDLRRAK